MKKINQNFFFPLLNLDVHNKEERPEEITFKDRRHSWPCDSPACPSVSRTHTRAGKPLGLSPEVPPLLRRKSGGNCWAHPEGVSPARSTDNPHQCSETRQCLWLPCFHSKRFIWLKLAKLFQPCKSAVAPV